MSISIACPKCSASYQVAESSLGKMATCKKCSSKFKLRRPSSQNQPTDVVKVRVVDKVVDKPDKDSKKTDANSGRKKVSSKKREQPDAASSSKDAELVTATVVAQPKRLPSTTLAPVVDSTPGQFDSNDFLAADLNGALNLVDRMNVDTQRAAKKADEQITISAKDLRDEIRGQIQKVPVTFKYRLAAAIVSFLMILLPLIYAGLIFAVMTGMYFYATWGLGMFQGLASRGRSRGAFVVLIAYIGPLLIGAITIAFMIKPFFAGSAKANAKRSLTRKQQPRLFAFVDRLCESVHAPKPTRIDIDCDVNASAGFDSGLLSLLTGNLVLTIGLPLAAGMSTRQLSGVLAHEFGHFTQGFGMRVSYLIRVISSWFSRIVYQRDQWDEYLIRASQELDLRLGVIFYVARFIVWINRGILWCLMMIGHIVSCFLLRQMEFDADLHEIRFAGSETFAKTSMRLREMGFGQQSAFYDIRAFMADGKIPDNIPELARINADSLEKDVAEELQKAVDEEETKWFETHPADKHRIAAADRERSPGIFELEAPASALFDNFHSLCRTVTNDLYKEHFEKELQKNKVIPVATLAADKMTSLANNQASSRTFGHDFGYPRILPFESVSDGKHLQPKEAVARLREIVPQMQCSRDEYAEISFRAEEQDDLRIDASIASMLKGFGGNLKQSNYKFPIGSLSQIQSALTNANQQLKELENQMAFYEEKFVWRVKCVFQLADNPKILEKASDELPQMRAQAIAGIGALRKLIPLAPTMVELRNDFSLYTLILSVISEQSGGNVGPELIGWVEQQACKIHTGLKSIGPPLVGTPYPFQHTAPIELSQYIVPQMPAPDAISDLISAGQTAVEGYHATYFRCIGALCRMCETVEKVIGLPEWTEPPKTCKHQEEC